SSPCLARKSSRRCRSFANATGSASTPSRRRRSGSTSCATRDPGRCPEQPVDSLTRGQLADLRFIDRPDGFVKPSEGPLVLRGQVVRVFDEREMLESSQDLGGQLPVDVAHSEVAMQWTVSHAERFDERLEHDATIEFESLQPVAPVDFLRNERTEQLHPLGESAAPTEKPADERLRVQRGNDHASFFVEEEHGLAVDLPYEEFVRRGKGHHREVDEQVLAGPLETIELLMDPRGIRPRHRVLQPDWG